MNGDTQRVPSQEHQAPKHDGGAASLSKRRRLALAEIDQATFSRFHVKLCLVAGIGFFTDAYDVFAISIVATMLQYAYPPNLDPETSIGIWQSAGLKAATPIGNLIGQLLFGWLADILGRKRMYGIELVIMIVATFGQAVSGQGRALNIVAILIFWRVILGIGVGGDYPLSAVIASEFASTRTRGRLMTAVFSFQGWGQLAASLVGLVAVVAFKDHTQHQVDSTWRLLIGLGCVPAVIALYFRLTIPETPRFTMDIDRRVSRAARDIKKALSSRGYNIYVDNDDAVNEPRIAAPRASRDDFITYFSKLQNLKVLFGTAYSWFALDIVFYTLTLDSTQYAAQYIFGTYEDTYRILRNLCAANVILTVAGYLPGFAASFLLIDVWGRRPIQLMGFVVLTILFLIMGFVNLPNHPLLALFCLANFFQNFGPNTTTFVVPGEVFPTRYRSTAYGISAASGKLGAVVAQFLFTAVNKNSSDGTGFFRILKGLSFVMMTGVLSTLLIPETKQQTLEDLSNEDQESYIMGTLAGGRVVHVQV